MDEIYYHQKPLLFDQVHQIKTLRYKNSCGWVSVWMKVLETVLVMFRMKCRKCRESYFAYCLFVCVCVFDSLANSVQWFYTRPSCFNFLHICFNNDGWENQAFFLEYLFKNVCSPTLCIWSTSCERKLNEESREKAQSKLGSRIIITSLRNFLTLLTNSQS